MKRTLLLILLATALFGQKDKPKQVAPTTDPDARYMCRIGSYHNCACMAMVAEVHEDAYRMCQLNSKSDKDYAACVKTIPQSCHIIQSPDTRHPTHSCRRSCAKARCACDDGPPCFGPSLTEYNEEGNHD